MIKSNFPSFFRHKKWQSSNFRTFSDLKNGKVQISKLFPNISELFIRNSELYSESPLTEYNRSEADGAKLMVWSISISVMSPDDTAYDCTCFPLANTCNL